MFICDKVKYVGVNDRETDLFEGQYKIPEGISYNSYVVSGEKIAVTDGVDEKFSGEWLKNVENALNGKSPDYLVILHMEPDHSASVADFIKKYPGAIVVSNSKTFAMAENFFGKNFAPDRLEVKDGDSLDLGGITLKFVFAPMVHWPEVMFAYCPEEKILFSADAFGRFGDLNSESPWADEARRYYIGIVGKYGVQVQNALKKAAGLNIEKICPLHGEILSGNLAYYITLYNIWSSYAAETDGTMIAYTSVYGHTKVAVGLLAEELRAKGEFVALYDLARTDRSLAVAEAFRYGKLVLATTTYNGDVFPQMRDFINDIVEHNYQNRTVGFIENGSWAPVAKRKMTEMLSVCKNMTFAESSVKILSAVSEQNKEEIKKLAEEFGAK